VLFGGGLAIKTHNSPLLIGFICGIITANFCRHRLRALETAVRSEKSIYIIILIILGAGWTLKFNFILLITGIYFAVRILGKIVGTFAATRSFKADFNIPPTAGLGLIAEGGLAVAIIINFSFLYPWLSDYLVTIIILSMFINEIISPKLVLLQFDSPEPKEIDNNRITKKRNMIQRIIGLFLLFQSHSWLKTLIWAFTRETCPALVLGTMLLGAYCFGFILEQIGLPRIVGYILAGLLMGPFFLKFYTVAEINNLNFINQLTLAFIALCAGGELRLASIRKLLKSIVYYISGVTIVVFIGTTLAIFTLSAFMPFMANFPPRFTTRCFDYIRNHSRCPFSLVRYSHYQ